MKLSAHPRPVVKILCLSALLAAALPIASVDVRADEQGKNLASKLQHFVDSHTLAGAVTLVATKDKILDLSAVGYADVAAKKPMTTDALFWIASMSKPITATALMMLVDEGKVNVDDPVEKYLPGLKGKMRIKDKDPKH